MQEFRIRPDAYAKLRKKAWLFYGIVLLLTVGIAVTTISIKSDSSIMNDLPPLFISVGVAAALISFSIFRGMKKQKIFLQNYRLTIEENVITREMPNTEELTIYFHEIKEITRFKKGSLAIKGFDKTDIIYVPRQITNYEEFVTQLNAIKPIAPLQGAASIRRKLAPVLSLVFIALLITVYTATNKILVVIAGILVTAGLVWWIIEMRRNKNISNDVKKKWWIYVLFLLMVVGIVCSKLFDIL